MIKTGQFTTNSHSLKTANITLTRSHLERYQRSTVENWWIRDSRFPNSIAKIYFFELHFKRNSHICIESHTTAAPDLQTIQTWDPGPYFLSLSFSVIYQCPMGVRQQNVQKKQTKSLFRMSAPLIRTGPDWPNKIRQRQWCIRPGVPSPCPVQQPSTLMLLSHRHHNVDRARRSRRSVNVRWRDVSSLDHSTCEWLQQQQQIINLSSTGDAVDMDA